jgi:hypothetical protein
MTKETKAPEVAAQAVETKADKFKRLGNARTAKAMDAIANIGGLANTASYEYSPEQVQKIFGALEGELTKLQERFKSPSASVAAAVSIL